MPEISLFYGIRVTIMKTIIHHTFMQNIMEIRHLLIYVRQEL